MTIAVDILDEVKDIVILKNGDVVRFAFNLIKSRFYCNCPWSTNRNEFAFLLKHYIHAKCSMTRRKWWQPKGNLEKEIISLRQRLSLIWPCENCFTKFNPTGRKRK